MKILFAGKDDFTYNRTIILRAGLDKIPEVQTSLFNYKEGFDKKKWQESEAWADLIYIPPLRHGDVAFVRKRTKKPIIFDPLISKYLTRTGDHGKWWTAWEKKWRDRMGTDNCDWLIMDTQAHLDWMVKAYQFDPAQTGIVPIGADVEKFKPETKVSSDIFQVGFYGGFVPLQGVDRIVQCAKLLEKEEDIRFDIIGYGPFYKKVKALAEKLSVKQVDFKGWVQYDELNKSLNHFDLALGVFGTSLKTDLVIPNKIYHYAAMRTCIVTKDTPGIRENFTDGENIVLTQNDPEKMAEKILDLKSNTSKREAIAEKGYQLVRDQYNEDVVAKAFVEVARKALS